MSAERAPWDDWTLSKRGLLMLASWEGGARPPYRDEAGNWTAGVGHRIASKAKGADWGEMWSQWLRDDTAHVEACINRLVKVPLTQTQADALIMLVFNIGCEAFRGSHLRKCLNEEKTEAARAWWLIWHYEHGESSDGLLRRRNAEWKLFSTATYSNA